MSKKTVRSLSSRQISDDEACGLRRRPSQSRVPRRPVHSRAQHEFAELAGAARPDLLREKGASRAQDAGDLLPPGDDRMTADHQVERPVSERKGRPVVLGGDDMGSERPKQPCRDSHVGRVTLGGHQQGWMAGQRGQHLPPARLDVQHPRRPGTPVGNQLGVPPARSVLAGPSRQPAEIPSLDGHRIGLGDQLLERACRWHRASHEARATKPSQRDPKPMGRPGRRYMRASAAATSSTRPYSMASSAVRKRPRSASSSTRCRGWPVASDRRTQNALH